MASLPVAMINPTKNDTTLLIEVNQNPCQATLMEPLQNVSRLQLVYFRCAHLTVFPPEFLYLELDAISARPRLHTSTSQNQTWTATEHYPPRPSNYPLLFDLANQGTPATYPIIHGYQGKMGMVIEDIGRLSDLKVKLCDGKQIPVAFGTETVLSLTFRVWYEGKRNLDPSEQIRLYSRFGN